MSPTGYEIDAQLLQRHSPSFRGSLDRERQFQTPVLDKLMFRHVTYISKCITNRFLAFVSQPVKVTQRRETGIPQEWSSKPPLNRSLSSQVGTHFRKKLHHSQTTNLISASTTTTKLTNNASFNVVITNPYHLPPSPVSHTHEALPPPIPHLSLITPHKTPLQ